jgi:uncharacterized protein (TIGR03083 family)
MEPTVADYRELIRSEGASLLAQLERLPDEAWATPSPCSDWDILSVVVHLQLGLMVHARMVENGLAGRMVPPWTTPEGIEARDYFRQVHQDSRAEGPAVNLALLRQRLAGYDAALAQASDADLDKDVWFYGLPGSTLRRPIAALTNDLIVHATDIRRPLGLEPVFSSEGARFTGLATLALLPMFTHAALLGGATGVVRQTIDGQTSTVTLGPDGIQVSSDAATSPTPSTGAAADVEPSPATRVGELTVDGATWTLLVWRQIPPADAERSGQLQISGDRALVEAYLGAIKTP